MKDTKKVESKKLTLNKGTLRRLEPTAAAKVVGGLPNNSFNGCNHTIECATHTTCTWF